MRMRFSRAHFAFVVVAVLVCAAQSQATVVVAVRTRARVIIGADSTTINDDLTKASNSVCKLVVSGRFVFALTGFTFSGPFNAFNLARTNAVANAASMAEANKNFVDAVAPALTAMVVVQSRRQPQSAAWKEKAKSCGPTKVCGSLLQYAVAGYERGVPKLMVNSLDFEAPIGSSVSARQVELSLHPAELNESASRQPVFVGIVDDIANEWRPLLTVEESALPLEIERVIRKQIIAKPKLLGLPIDMIEVTASGPRWISAKPACHATYTK